LASQPTAGWREQVGLPIVEGLAHGCRVVTTDQTGLAGWLREHADRGHRVVPAGGSGADLAAAVLAALTTPTGDGPGSVLADLPVRDGRLAADDWLFEPGPDRS
jgi:glycosyltransferase involved in cell wall biosynthesis